MSNASLNRVEKESSEELNHIDNKYDDIIPAILKALAGEPAKQPLTLLPKELMCCLRASD